MEGLICQLNETTGICAVHNGGEMERVTYPSITRDLIIFRIIYRIFIIINQFIAESYNVRLSKARTLSKARIIF